MPHATFDDCDLTKFCRLDELGLVATGQRLEPDRTVLACRVLDADDWCHRCGQRGTPLGTVIRTLAHEPVGWRPTTLRITVRRYQCDDCAHVWRQDTTKAAEPMAKLSRRALRWALEALVLQHLTVARVAESLAVRWNTANDAVLAEGKRVLIDDPARFDGVTAIGVDEHVWRHTRRGDKYVTVIIDLTGLRAGTGPARLLDMVEGRSKQVFKTWLAERDQGWLDQIEVVAMDGFSGFKTAASEELPEAVAVMDPFHVVRLAADALERCRRRVQQQVHGHRGRKQDPLYKARRTLLTFETIMGFRHCVGAGRTVLDTAGWAYSSSLSHPCAHKLVSNTCLSKHLHGHLSIKFPGDLHRTLCVVPRLKLSRSEVEEGGRADVVIAAFTDEQRSV